MTTIVPSLCRACVHADRTPAMDDDGSVQTWAPARCAAYPDGIPMEILFGGDHQEPRGDEVDGLVYDEADSAEAREAFDAWEAFAAADGGHG